MDTRLINSQLVARKDIRVWFWDGEREYEGEVVAMGENGAWMEIKVRRPTDGTILNLSAYLDTLRRKLKDRVVDLEVSSPRIQGRIKARLATVDVISQKKDKLSVVATYEAPPDPNLLRVLQDPVVTKIQKKSPQ